MLSTSILDSIPGESEKSNGIVILENSHIDHKKPTLAGVYIGILTYKKEYVSQRING